MRVYEQHKDKDRTPPVAIQPTAHWRRESQQEIGRRRTARERAAQTVRERRDKKAARAAAHDHEKQH